MNMSTLAALPMPLKVGAGAVAGLLLAGAGAGVTLIATHAGAPTKTPAAIASPAPLGAHQPPRAGTQLKAQQAMRTALLAAAATALGMDAATLRSDLNQGQTLQSLAAGKYPSEDAFRAALLALIKPLLDQDVGQGLITAQQEQRYMQQLQAGPIPFWGGPARPRSSPAPTH